jgi:hypothetical protein
MYSRDNMYKNSNDSAIRPLAQNPDYGMLEWKFIFELGLTLSVLSRGCGSRSTPNRYAMPPKKRGVSKWVKIGVPVALVILVGIAVGAYFGVRNKSNANAVDGNGNKQGNGNGNGNGNNNGGTSINLEDSRLAISTDTWMQPVYPSTVSHSARYTQFGANNKQPAARPTPRSLHSPHSVPRTRRHGLKMTSFKLPPH